MLIQGTHVKHQVQIPFLALHRVHTLASYSYPQKSNCDQLALSRIKLPMTKFFIYLTLSADKSSRTPGDIVLKVWIHNPIMTEQSRFDEYHNSCGNI